MTAAIILSVQELRERGGVLKTEFVNGFDLALEGYLGCDAIIRRMMFSASNHESF